MLTEEQAIKLYDSEWWKDKTDYEIAKFQLFEERLCVPFSIFHGCLERTIGRPIFTHEFAINNAEHIKEELLGDRKAPTFEEIINMIPEAKRIVVVVENKDGDFS